MYIPDHFKLYELLPKSYYKKDNRLWNIFDDRLLITIDNLRNKYGKMLVNDWYWKGENQYRGWRPLDCKVGAEFSQHKFGRAVDLILLEVDVNMVRKEIIDNQFSEDFKYITCMEDNTSWLHIDVRNHNKKNGILIVLP